MTSRSEANDIISTDERTRQTQKVAAPRRESEPEPINTTQKTENMAWKPKTIAGKILKGAVIGGGTILGVASGVGAIAGVAGGVGAAAGAVSGVSTVANAAAKLATGGAKIVGGTLSKVAQGAVNLVTGTTAEERKQVRAVKAETKAAEDKLEQVQRLVRAGATTDKARAMVGLSAAELPEINGVKTAPSNNTILYAGLGVIALFLLPKMLKR